MRSFKKIAAMIMAVAMLCSFTALAADVELLPVSDADSDNTMVTIGYDWNKTTASQTTMLVYRGEALEGADVVYINQFAEKATPVTLDLTGAEPGGYTVIAGGMDVAEAKTKTFNFTALTYDVTLTVTGDGFVENDYDAANLSATPVAVNKDEVINFEIIPHLGNVAAVTVNGVPFAGDGKLSVKVDGAKDIVIAFTEATTTEEVKAMSGADIHTLPGKPESEDPDEKYESKLMFGKAIAPAGQEILEAGMYLEKLNEENDEFEPYEVERQAKVGPYFKAENQIDGKYGIRFIRFNKGTYRVKSYVKYGEDQYAWGKEVEFVVE